MKLPARAPDKNVSVVALEIEGDAKMDGALLQNADGRVLLEAFAGDIHQAAKGSQLERGRPHDWLWDGRGDDGRPVASGVYFYALSSDRGRQVGKLVILR